MRQGNKQRVQCCSGATMAVADKNEQWCSREYLLELWDTGPHQDPARKKDKRRDYRRANRHAKLGQKKKKNGKFAMGESAAQETEKSTDEQADSQQICKCWDTLFSRGDVVSCGYVLYCAG